MHDAILRQARPPISPDSIADGVDHDEIENVFRPEECVNFAEALWMYTIGAAYAANCENILGQVRKPCIMARSFVIHTFCWNLVGTGELCGGFGARKSKYH